MPHGQLRETLGLFRNSINLTDIISLAFSPLNFTFLMGMPVCYDGNNTLNTEQINKGPWSRLGYKKGFQFLHSVSVTAVPVELLSFWEIVR